MKIGSNEWMLEQGFIPDYGTDDPWRWTHVITQLTAIRQPWMTAEEWLAHKVFVAFKVEQIPRST